MTLNHPAPPLITGRATDTADLSEWCAVLIAKLKNLLTHIDGNDVISLSPDKLTNGSILLDTIDLNGSNVYIDSSSIALTHNGAVIFRAEIGDNGARITLSNSDGSQYINLSNDNISICVNEIKCSTITAAEYLDE